MKLLKLSLLCSAFVFFNYGEPNLVEAKKKKKKIKTKIPMPESSSPYRPDYMPEELYCYGCYALVERAL